MCCVWLLFVCLFESVVVLAAIYFRCCSLIVFVYVRRYVTKKIVRAIRANQERLVMPWLCYLVRSCVVSSPHVSAVFLRLSHIILFTFLMRMLSRCCEQVPVARSILPLWIQDPVMSFLKINESMDEFKGRQKTE